MDTQKKCTQKTREECHIPAEEEWKEAKKW